MPRTPPDSQPFAGAIQTSQSPVLILDEIGDQQVLELVDFHSPLYTPSNYGDLFPGLVSTDGTAAVLYATFQLVDWVPLKYPIVKRLWQNLPGSFVQVDKPNTETGIVNPVFRRKQVATAINPGEYLPVPWAASTVFKEDTVILGGTGVFICVTPGTSGATAPTWPSVGIITDNTAAWLFVSTAGIAWQASHAYTIPQQVIGGAYLFECSVAGTSGSSAPSWPSTYGATVTDGGVTWVNIGQAALVIVERQDINKYMAWEIITVKPSGLFNSFATAKTEEKTIAYTFPGRIFVPAIMAFASQGTFYNEPSAKDTIALIRTFWVNSLSKVTFPFDQIIFRGQITVNQNPGAWNGNSKTTPVATYSNVLWDANGQYILALDGTITIFFYPNTQPSNAQYTGLVAATGTITATNGSAILTGGGIGQIQVGDVFGGLLVVSLSPPTLSVAWPYDTQNVPYFTRPSSAWLGNYKNVDGDVKDDESPFRVRVTVIQILME